MNYHRLDPRSVSVTLLVLIISSLAPLMPVFHRPPDPATWGAAMCRSMKCYLLQRKTFVCAKLRNIYLKWIYFYHFLFHFVCAFIISIFYTLNKHNSSAAISATFQVLYIPYVLLNYLHEHILSWKTVCITESCSTEYTMAFTFGVVIIMSPLGNSCN